jgi:FkbM family methyltransferase
MQLAAFLERLGLLRQRIIFDTILVSPNELHRVWEEMHLRRLLTHYKVDCVFDVGANVGQYADTLREYVGYRGMIVSFEPNPDAYLALRDKANRDPLWIVENLALSSFDGEQTFNVMAESQFSSLSQPTNREVALFQDMNKVTKTVRVPTETLSTAFRRIQRSHRFAHPFLKLDTQGYDVEILRHGQDILHNFVGLQSELSIRRIYEQSVDFREAIAIYEALGFALSAFVPNNAGHFPMLVETDCIMVRRDLLQAPGAGAPHADRQRAL